MISRLLRERALLAKHSTPRIRVQYSHAYLDEGREEITRIEAVGKVTASVQQLINRENLRRFPPIKYRTTGTAEEFAAHWKRLGSSGLASASAFVTDTPHDNGRH